MKDVAFVTIHGFHRDDHIGARSVTRQVRQLLLNPDARRTRIRLFLSRSLQKSEDDHRTELRRQVDVTPNQVGRGLPYGLIWTSQADPALQVRGTGLKRSQPQPALPQKRGAVAIHV